MSLYSTANMLIEFKRMEMGLAKIDPAVANGVILNILVDQPAANTRATLTDATQAARQIDKGVSETQDLLNSLKGDSQSKWLKGLLDPLNEKVITTAKEREATAQQVEKVIKDMQQVNALLSRYIKGEISMDEFNKALQPYAAMVKTVRKATFDLVDKQAMIEPQLGEIQKNAKQTAVAAGVNASPDTTQKLD